MLPRQLFVDAGGFDLEPALAQWSDVDLCLRLQQAGYLNVFAARAQLLIDPFDTTPATSLDEEAMYARWLPMMANDPAYNPGFRWTPVPASRWPTRARAGGRCSRGDRCRA